MDAKNLILCLDAMNPQQAILIRGDHGVGKSQIVGGLSKRCSKTLIDVRASTLQEGDVVGYPDLDKIKSLGMAVFALPSWYVRACKEPCILFLDELNRGLIGVLNGMFQIVLDRELGNGPDGKPMRLHPETQVIAAVNVGSSYTVTDMDPALLSRFWVQDLTPTVQDWLDWAKSEEGCINELLVDFIAQNPAHLRPTKEVEPGKKTPDQRAWEKLDKQLKFANIDLSEMGGRPPEILYPIASGFVGVEAAAALVDFVKNYRSIITAEDIHNNFPDLKEKVTKLATEKRLAIIEKLRTHVKQAQTPYTAKQIENIVGFFGVLTGEEKMHLYNGFLASGNLKILPAFHNHVKEEILDLINRAQNVSKANKK